MMVILISKTVKGCAEEDTDKLPSDGVMEDIAMEVFESRKQHPIVHSAHHGYAIILEELDELWAEIKKRPGERDKRRMREEAIQVAATAIRFIEEVV